MERLTVGLVFQPLSAPFRAGGGEAALGQFGDLGFELLLEGVFGFTEFVVCELLALEGALVASEDGVGAVLIGEQGVLLIADHDLLPVPDVDPILRAGVRLVLKNGDDAGAVGGMVLWQFGAGDFAESRKHIGEFNKITHDAPWLLDASRPTGDERHACSRVAHGAFASHNLSSVPRSDDRLVRAVVAREDDKSVIAYAGLFQLHHDLPDGLIGIGDHVAEMALRILTIALVGGGAESLRIPVGGVGCGIKWAVGKDHRIVDQKGLLFVLVDKVADEIGAYLRAVFAIGVILFLSVDFQQRVYKAAIDVFAAFVGAATTGVLPEAGLLEAKMLRRVFILSELPFARDRGRVSGFFQLMGKGGLSSIQPAELDVVTDIVLSGHEFHPGGGADRVGKTVGEAHTLRRQLVEVGRLAGFAAVGRQGLVAHVIGHDEDDVWPRLGSKRPSTEEYKKAERENGSNHGKKGEAGREDCRFQRGNHSESAGWNIREVTSGPSGNQEEDLPGSVWRGL